VAGLDLLCLGLFVASLKKLVGNKQVYQTEKKCQLK
jgi:hypothetical protein